MDAVSGTVRLEQSITRAALEQLCLNSWLMAGAPGGRVWLAGKTLPLQLQMVGPRLEGWFEAAPDHALETQLALGSTVVIGFNPKAAALLSARFWRESTILLPQHPSGQQDQRHASG